MSEEKLKIEEYRLQIGVLTREELKGLFGWNDNTLNRYNMEGMPRFKAGRELYFDVKEVLGFLKKRYSKKEYVEGRSNED